MDGGDYPRTVTATADSFNEAVEQIRSELPEGVNVLSTSVVVHALVSHVDGRASTIERATAEARNQLPRQVELVERSVEVRQSPGRSVVAVEAFDERAAIALVARQAPSGHMVENAATLVSSGGRRLGIGKARPNQYEVGVLRQAEVRITYFQRAVASAVIGTCSELTRLEMEALYDLLAIFRRGWERGPAHSVLHQEYVDWWFEQQWSAAEMAMKLRVLGENACPALGGEQANQMSWLVGGVSNLLEGRQPLTKDQITAKLDFGCTVTAWHVGGMTLLCCGHFYGPVLFSECFEALGAALA